MAKLEPELVQVRRRVAEGERHVADQRRIVAPPRMIGGSTDLAERLLALFEHSLRAHRVHLARLEALPHAP
ncbi:MAG TPA: hypothetical protein VEA60_15265 [Allosphingosinicella sp.]|nr:hypothetical protein [Allosphingosinicella sp.]